MFQELALGGMLFSPLLLMMPLAFLMSVITRIVIYQTGVYRQLWKPAWVEVSLYICYLAVVVWLGS
ncbi:DUF1656 domain-containing protein [Alteromonas ponticola]|uniref:DUF1656 domain-containing protein n=1 Tax=Alteromonas aquimaris TaxID=2998417 RepID=A0ABT3P5U9_9ALTE|nr:DUF1656 domain-containing protein [Alteromonas aquimaris]MCW8108146.1 DUF1656 domain-containing protein [Alteromonas aquimaris]